MDSSTAGRATADRLSPRWKPAEGDQWAVAINTVHGICAIGSGGRERSSGEAVVWRDGSTEGLAVADFRAQTAARRGNGGAHDAPRRRP